MAEKKESKDTGTNGEGGLTISNPLADPISDTSATPPPSDKTPAGDSLSREKIADATKKEKLVLETGMDDAEFEHQVEDSFTSHDTHTDEDEHTTSPPGRFARLLAIIGGPESTIRKAWQQSSIRDYLLQNVDALREEDENRRMEEVIEQTYGGALEKKFAPGHFIKNNILFSTLVALLLTSLGFLALQNFFPDLFPQIPVESVSRIERKNALKKQQEAASKMPVEINHINKVAIEETLAHCLIVPVARQQFSEEFSNAGYQFNNRKLTIAYEEVRNFIKSWSTLNIDSYVADSASRFKTLAATVKPEIDEIKQTIQSYQDSIRKRQADAQALQQRIHELTTSTARQSTRVINERIQLRNKLTQLQVSLENEPDTRDFSALTARIDELVKNFSGQRKPTRILPEDINENAPSWVRTLPQTTASDFAASLNNTVMPEIARHREVLRTARQELATFHIRELTELLQQVQVLVSLVNYLPENMLLPYEAEVIGLGRRLDSLMARSLPQWMFFDVCLANARPPSSSGPADK